MKPEHVVAAIIGVGFAGGLVFYLYASDFANSCCGDGGCGCAGNTVDASQSGTVCIMPNASGKLSMVQIAQLAANAGFSGNDLPIACAICIAESNGNPNAYNPEHGAGAAQGKGSYGLWQIFITAHPEYTPQSLVDPQTNANAAFKIYQAAGNSFRPWSTFKNNAYQAHLADAQAAISCGCSCGGCA